jgi:hypothetical protein
MSLKIQEYEEHSIKVNVEFCVSIGLNLFVSRVEVLEHVNETSLTAEEQMSFWVLGVHEVIKNVSSYKNLSIN